MANTVTAPPKTDTRAEPRVDVERPRLHKVILNNDDFTPREFVVTVLKAVFRMGRETAHGVMLTAHLRGACVVAVFTREVAETKVAQADAMAHEAGHPLRFTAEPED